MQINLKIFIREQISFFHTFYIPIDSVFRPFDGNSRMEMRDRFLRVDFNKSIF